MTEHRASTVKKAQVEVKRLWNLMCECEGVAYDAQFVEFRTSNPYAKDYNKAMKKFLRLRQDIKQVADLRAQHNAIVRALAVR